MASLGQTTISAEIIRTTDDAILVDYDGDEVWIPRKVCIGGDRLEEGDSDILIARWWAESNLQ